MTDIIETTVNVDANNCSLKASLLLANHSKLSQGKIKEAMQKGAVWLLRGKSKKRLRRASKSLLIGDKIELNYNPQILNQDVPKPQLVDDAVDYSVWFKPYGLYCQGSRWGDISSIARWLEVNISSITRSPQRPVFLVHRLDRATTGLILLCHSKNSARLFSQMFAKGQIDKRYQAVVYGDFSKHSKDFKVNKEVDGKPSESLFSFVEYKDGKSLLDIQLLTGRKHQIRQHLSSIGFPIVGDRLYGKQQSLDCDLQLQSVALQFLCPITHKQQKFLLADSYRIQF